MRLFVLDIGNSRATAALVAGKTVRRISHFPSPPGPGALRAVVPDPDAVAVCSVAPAKNAAWQRALSRAFPRVPRRWLSHDLDFGIPVTLSAPAQTGLDRYADAVAAAETCGTPCIACDFGTATTFNLVLPRKGFVGGAIAPGFGMWFEALHAGTAQIPAVPPSGALRIPCAGNTADALRLGSRWGFRGMVAEILYQLSQAVPQKDRPRIAYCATGGWAPRVLKDCGLELVHLPHLTLRGIARICTLNPPSP
jgi:type III pantothenate kinase